MTLSGYGQTGISFLVKNSLIRSELWHGALSCWKRKPFAHFYGLFFCTSFCKRPVHPCNFRSVQLFLLEQTTTNNVHGLPVQLWLTCLLEVSPFSFCSPFKSLGRIFTLTRFISKLYVKMLYTDSYEMFSSSESTRIVIRLFERTSFACFCFCKFLRSKEVLIVARLQPTDFCF